MKKYQRQKNQLSSSDQDANYNNLIQYETAQHIFSISLINKNLFFSYLCKADGNVYESKQHNISIKMVSQQKIQQVQDVFQYLKSYQNQLHNNQILSICQNNNFISIKFPQNFLQKKQNFIVNIFDALRKNVQKKDKQPFQIILVTKKQQIGQQQRLMNCQNIYRQQLSALKKQGQILLKQKQHKQRLSIFMNKTIKQQQGQREQLRQIVENNLRKKQQLIERLKRAKKAKNQSTIHKRILTQNVQQLNEKILKLTSATKDPRNLNNYQNNNRQLVSSNNVNQSQDNSHFLAQSESILCSDRSLLTIQSEAIDLQILKNDDSLYLQKKQINPKLYQSSDFGNVQKIKKFVEFIKQEQRLRESVIGILNKLKEKQQKKDKKKKQALRSPRNVGNKQFNFKDNPNKISHQLTKQEAKKMDAYQQLTNILKNALNQRKQKKQKDQSLIKIQYDSPSHKSSSSYSKKSTFQLFKVQQSELDSPTTSALKKMSSIALSKDQNDVSEFWTKSFFVSKKPSPKQSPKSKQINNPTSSKSSSIKNSPPSKNLFQNNQVDSDQQIIQFEKISNKNREIIECFNLSEQRKGYSVKIINSKNFNIKIGIKGRALDLRASQLMTSAILKQRVFYLKLNDGTIWADGLLVIQQEIHNKKGQIIKLEIDINKKTIQWSLDNQCFSFVKIPKNLITDGKFDITSYVQIEDKGDRIQLF